MTALILASASPRRRELLRRAGVRFSALSADIDETRRPSEPPRAYAERIAVEKAASVRQPGAFVLAADTIVVLDDEVLHKPTDAPDAERILARLAGRTHVVMTACVLRTPADERHLLTVATEVDFRAISPEERRAYVAAGEWRGKAGGYAAQGLGAAFIPAIRGSYTNVVGLPLCEVLELLRRVGAPGADVARGEPA
jgi:septum formation protein